MEWFVGWIGTIVLFDAFDGAFTTRKEWEVVIGLVLMALGVLIYLFDRD